ncbi:hypothetical protein BDZ97DRAFT_1843678 [Flammula alnicola]|nr:hypothetical protein BDZ97DRAFT_1843678 [Flammula alnicola]
MRFITRFRTYQVDKNQSTNLVEVREEARLIFGDVRKVGLLVSLGTGQPGTIGLKKPDAFQKLLPTKLIDTLKNIATDCEAVADALTAQFITHPGLYFRFNVTHGAGEVSLEEWEMIGTVVAHTESYLRDARVSADVDAVVSHLCGEPQRPSSLTLAALCGVPQRPAVADSSSVKHCRQSSSPFKYVPAPPDTMFGRDAEKAIILGVLLNNEPAHITTLSQSVLHDEQVIAKYGTQHRYFVSCEVVFELANALRIPATDRKDDLDQRVLTALRQQPMVLCLDNFETIWEVERPPRPFHGQNYVAWIFSH